MDPSSLNPDGAEDAKLVGGGFGVDVLDVYTFAVELLRDARCTQQDRMQTLAALPRLAAITSSWEAGSSCFLIAGGGLCRSLATSLDMDCNSLSCLESRPVVAEAMAARLTFRRGWKHRAFPRHGYITPPPPPITLNPIKPETLNPKP